MMKNLVAAVMFLCLSTNVVWAQDDVSKKLIAALEQIQTLKDEIAQLTKDRLVLENEKANLEKEVAQLKSGGAKKPASKEPTLSDLFVVGAVFTGKSEVVAGLDRGNTGSGTMTITARDGDSFSATNVYFLDKDKSTGTAELKGTIIGPNKAKWNRQDGPVANEVQAMLRKDGMYIDTIGRNAKGQTIKSVWKVGR